MRVQLVGLVHAVRPLVHARVRVEILVGQVAQILRPGVVEDLAESGRFVALGKLAIAVIDGHLVPIADARRVGVGDVDGAVGAQFLLRVRIVHHRNPALGAVVIIVAQAERVAHFVSGQLADARQRGLVQDVGLLGAVGVRREQPSKIM
jgi:hypothetical protein